MRSTPPPLVPVPDASGVRRPKTVLLAEHYGFCHGVKKAVDKTVACATATDNGVQRPVYVLGQLIHNSQVIDRLSEQGIRTVASLEEVPPGSLCVVRTHGAPPQLAAEAESRGVAVADATCPDVRLVQNKAIELAREGYTVVVVGKADHPEVIGITAHAQEIPGARIVAIHRAQDIAEKLHGLPCRRIGVVSQTTQMEDAFFDMIRELARIAKELKVFNTICPATFYRQSAALDLAARVDLMVVVGGKNSSNTTHLAEICRAQGTETIHIEVYTELIGHPALAHAQTVGVTAGASTPEWLVQEVIESIQAL